MKKIVSNILVVTSQLLVGGLFLIMIFSDKTGDNKVVVVRNNNLTKMADVVSSLYVSDTDIVSFDNDFKEVLLNASDNEEILDEEIVSSDVETVSKEESEPQKLVSLEVSKYISMPEKGFNVTSSNKSYSLSEKDFNIVAGVVSCEANRNSRDDILAVMSVILNRADKGYGGNLVTVVSAPNQFSCYHTPKTPTNLIIEVMNDALNGIRNNTYTGFRSWNTTNFSNNYICERGNRYR